MVKRVLAVFAGLAALAAVAAAGVYYWADATINNRRDDPKVLGAPPEAFERPVLAPYDGPHPRFVRRPDDPFPFPLRPGDLGPVEPLFAGPLEYPFLCRSVDSDLGQPVVDNHEGYGMAVFAEDEVGRPTGEVVGYAKDCRLPTRIGYWARTRDGEFHPRGSVEDREIARIEVDGRSIPFVVRVETGTIHRHIYLIAVLAGPDDEPVSPDLAHWNRRLIHYFRGGVGIGHRQGHTAIRTALKRRGAEIARGYALAYSSANQSATSYHIALQEDTAQRLKRQFTTAYGEPEYTVGIGGSGGAIQQYLLGQNRPGLLDAAITLYSYPDMITQSVNVLDCELLEYYFDVTAGDDPRWDSVANRSAVEGLHHNAGLKPRFWQVLWASQLIRGQWPAFDRGATECTRSWRGMTPVVMNPRYSHFSTRFAPELAARVRWTFWENLKQYFGTDDNGRPLRTWDNVGVQYGLEALREGQLSPRAFVDLNRRVGGWKRAENMAPERFALSDAGRSPLWDYSPWSHHNMTLNGDPAPRTTGDPQAIDAAWRSGQVFTGVIDIPVIDLRHYLEPELDMHHASASFASRLRIQDAMGDAGQQVIWMTRPPHMPYGDAFAAIDEWMAERAAHPERSAAATRPDHVLDRCWSGDGEVIAEGDGVWDGDWNGRPDGPCMTRYPIYGTSRTRAGETLRGHRFRCQLEDVDSAIDRGVYAPVDLSEVRAELRGTFPDGVCDLSRPPPGYPAELVEALAADARGADGHPANDKATTP